MPGHSPIDSQWFLPNLPCGHCGKKSSGILYGYKNASQGAFCEPCANKLIKKAHKRGNFWPDFVYENNLTMEEE